MFCLTFLLPCTVSGESPPPSDYEENAAIDSRRRPNGSQAVAYLPPPRHPGHANFRPDLLHLGPPRPRAGEAQGSSVGAWYLCENLNSGRGNY